MSATLCASFTSLSVKAKAPASASLSASKGCQRVAFSRSSFTGARMVALRTPAKQATTQTLECDAKMKTRKAAVKRFRITKNGKVKKRHPMKQHFNAKMSRSRNLRLTADDELKDSDYKAISRMIPYGRVVKPSKRREYLAKRAAEKAALEQ